MSTDAAALSRRDQANVDTLNQNMAAAEARYRQALVKIGNSDPDGQKQSDAALEDMEDTITACGKQKGCQVSTLLATYKRLLKLGADDGSGGDEEDDEIDPDDADPDHTGDGAIGRRRTPGGACRQPARQRTIASTRWCNTTRQCRRGSGVG